MTREEAQKLIGTRRVRPPFLCETGTVHECRQVFGELQVSKDSYTERFGIVQISGYEAGSFFLIPVGEFLSWPLADGGEQ